MRYVLMFLLLTGCSTISDELMCGVEAERPIETVDVKIIETWKTPWICGDLMGIPAIFINPFLGIMPIACSTISLDYIEGCPGATAEIPEQFKDMKHPWCVIHTISASDSFIMDHEIQHCLGYADE